MALPDPRVYVVSVPHSGVTWLLRRLFPALDLLLDMPERRDWQHVHVSPGADGRFLERAQGWVDSGAKVVVPVRDPALIAASSLNRGEIDHSSALRTVAAWQDQPNVHFIRVDAPEAQRATEIAALCSFLEVPEPDDVDWTPANTRADRTGLKAALGRGEEPAELRDALALRNDPGVRAVLRGR